MFRDSPCLIHETQADIVTANSMRRFTPNCCRVLQIRSARVSWKSSIVFEICVGIMGRVQICWNITIKYLWSRGSDQNWTRPSAWPKQIHQNQDLPTWLDQMSQTAPFLTPNGSNPRATSHLHTHTHSARIQVNHLSYSVPFSLCPSQSKNQQEYHFMTLSCFVTSNDYGWHRLPFIIIFRATAAYTDVSQHTNVWYY